MYVDIYISIHTCVYDIYMYTYMYVCKYIYVYSCKCTCDICRSLQDTRSGRAHTHHRTMNHTTTHDTAFPATIVEQQSACKQGGREQ